MLMEEKRKEDRRITRTKSALNQALAELVNEKGYESVTVEDITTRANLGRTTFYLHYQDKSDLLLEGLEEQLSQLANEIIQHPLIFWFRETNNNLLKSIFETFRENSEIFQIINREQSNKVYDRFQNMVTRVITKLIDESPWAQKKAGSLPVPIDYVIVYFSGAIWASIIWWTQNDFVLSTDEMVKSFRILFFPSLFRILKIHSFTDMADVISN
jgi:AcrR family transcriptional regulator